MTCVHVSHKVMFIIKTTLINHYNNYYYRCCSHIISHRL